MAQPLHTATALIQYWLHLKVFLLPNNTEKYSLFMYIKTMYLFVYLHEDHCLYNYHNAH